MLRIRRKAVSPLRSATALQSAFLSFALLAFFCAGCAKQAAPEVEAKVTAQFTPNPPVTGRNELEIAITDPSGKPLQLGKVRVEGNMNHAGMKPVFTELLEKDAGKYAGTIEFTMGGDWFLLVTSEGPGASLNQKIDVPGVKGK